VAFPQSLKLDTAQQCYWYKTSVLSSTFYTLLKGHKLNCINCRGRGRGSCTVNSFCAPYYWAQPCSLVKYLSNFVFQLMYRTANTVLHPVRLPAYLQPTLLIGCRPMGWQLGLRLAAICRVTDNCAIRTAHAPELYGTSSKNREFYKGNFLGIRHVPFYCNICPQFFSLTNNK
jgi:hypothetical protein